ncbi:MAG: hypothetical protein VR72_10055 [Clostridiaceae bacterium BRH_c20a]|nr:MAG: hypothetical protein VR72_10055 [Clostridiaceae bacterium BRH_c20a]
MAQYTSRNAKEFVDEAEKIITLAKEKGVTLRLIGALAFNLHCPQYNYIHERWGRVFTDTDFVSKVEYGPILKEVYGELGYQDDEMITTLYGSKRMVFDNPTTGFHSDIFFDQLDFCHILPLRERLNVDSLTIPLAELVLEKMQIVEINEKDLIDTIMLLLEHLIGESDDEVINAKIIANYLALDWGFWKTVTLNFAKLRTILGNSDVFNAKDKELVQERLALLEDYINKESKTLKWRMRDKIGTKVKWYKDVDEL